MANKVTDYEIAIGENGMKYATLESVAGDFLTIPYATNSKVGKAFVYSHSIEYSCDRTCECYKERICYGCGGCYTFGQNQAKYTNNLKFFMKNDRSVFVASVNDLISSVNDAALFRWFGVGDVPTMAFLECMVQIAVDNPAVKFWFYTKKYRLINKYVAEHGNCISKAFPVNLVCIFSHWRNKDGSYFPMPNPYGFPTSEFIPYGMESDIDLTDAEHTFVCPCSDPEFIGTCATCEKGCYNLKPGMHQCLLEHSTNATKERDAAIHAERVENKRKAKNK